MARPFIFTPPVTVEGKQIPVEPTSYPLTTTLTPPPAVAPYTTIDTQQDQVQPIASPVPAGLKIEPTRWLDYRGARGSQPLRQFGDAPETTATQPPTPGPLLSQMLRRGSQPLRPFAQQPEPVAPSSGGRAFAEPPPTTAPQPPTPGPLLSQMLKRTGQPLRDFTPLIRPDSKPGPYVTTLTQPEEAQFQSWVKANNIPFDPSPTSDYDMRGFWRSMMAGQAERSSTNLHFPDTFKTPYHQSFSNESMYATKDAPRWDGDRLIDKSGKVVFDEAQGGAPPPQVSTEPPETHTYEPSAKILTSIGVPPEHHEAMAPAVAKTFPKAVKPVQTPQTPPKAMRTTTRTVGNTLDKVSPLRQAAAPTGRKVVVSLPDKKVVVYDQAGKVLREFPAYIGRAATPTPRGQFRIMENIKPAESEWYYGGHWLGFAHGYKQEKNDIPYAGFHGWVYDKDDDAIEREEPGWKTSTGGCIQLGNKDVADLASLVAAGDPVTILDTPFAPPPPKPPVPQMRGGFFEELLRPLIGQ